MRVHRAGFHTAPPGVQIAPEVRLSSNDYTPTSRLFLKDAYPDYEHIVAILGPIGPVNCADSQASDSGTLCYLRYIPGYVHRPGKGC